MYNFNVRRHENEWFREREYIGVTIAFTLQSIGSNFSYFCLSAAQARKQTHEKQSFNNKSCSLTSVQLTIIIQYENRLRCIKL